MDTSAHLDQRNTLTNALETDPYNLVIYLLRSHVYEALGYPDLAVSDAYRALMLSDEVQDDSGEYHEDARASFEEVLKKDGVQETAPAEKGLGLEQDGLAERIERIKIDSTRKDYPCNEEEKKQEQDRNEDDDEEEEEEEEEEEGLPDELVEEHIRHYALDSYRTIAHNLFQIGCVKSAFDFCKRGLYIFKADPVLAALKQDIFTTHSNTTSPTNDIDPDDLPDKGLVRRELYPWNTHKPDRFSDESIAFLNAEMARVAPKCEVRVSTLPLLGSAVQEGGEAKVDDEDQQPDQTTQDLHAGTAKVPSNMTIKQLGVFAKQDILPGEVFLNETSLLTANNRLHEPLCDACSSVLPHNLPSTSLSSALAGEVEPPSPTSTSTSASSTSPSSSPSSPIITPAAADTPYCPECDDTVFCSQTCYDLAMETYHPAVCGKDVDAIAKDTSAREAADALYLLLLGRSIAMAETTEQHPLELAQVKYIWGDFTSPLTPVDSLPFTFASNILGPLHILEKMDLNIYTTLERYDAWVLNTLYAKFRGTASARLSTRDGRPEVSAVHPMWCLANHSCAPNVSWEWGGSVRFWAREKRVAWGSEGDGSREKVGGGEGGVKAGEELMSHYCDVELSVKDRREWAVGALGGLCMCERCMWEERHGN